MAGRYFCATCPWPRLSAALVASAPMAEMRGTLRDIAALAREVGGKRRRTPSVRESGPLCKLCVKVMGRDAALRQTVVELRKEAALLERGERVADQRGAGRRAAFDRKAKRVVDDVETSMDRGENE